MVVGADGVLEGVVCPADLERVVGTGFEESGVPGTLFEDSSRTFSSILEVSGVTGVFVVVFDAVGVGGSESDFADEGGIGVEGFEAVFGTGEGAAAAFDAVGAIVAFFAAAGVVFTGSSAALVDFALVVDFFVSGRSTSMGSDITFLGRPLFLTASADIM